jgi:type III restriction enzyme
MTLTTPRLRAIAEPVPGCLGPNTKVAHRAASASSKSRGSHPAQPCIEGSKGGNTRLDRRMYVTDAAAHAYTLNDWERDALADPDAIAWLRNDPRKPWSFTVSYQAGSEFKPMYPDLLVFRRQGDGLVCDILEPHTHAFADTVGKAKGLAAFARDHGDEFGRIRLIAKVRGAYKALALDDIDTRNKVLGVATSDHLDQLFKDA